jgi:hypothetical protein
MNVPRFCAAADSTNIRKSTCNLEAVAGRAQPLPAFSALPEDHDAPDVVQACGGCVAWGVPPT